MNNGVILVIIGIILCILICLIWFSYVKVKSKPITAEDAKKKILNKEYVSRSDCFFMLNMSIDNGEYACTIEGSLSPETIAELEKLGYKIEYYYSEHSEKNKTKIIIN